MATSLTPAKERAQNYSGGAITEYITGYIAVHHAVGLAAAGMEGLRDRPASDRRIQEAVRCLNRQFPNVPAAEVLPKVVIVGAVFQRPQIGGLVLHQEHVASMLRGQRLTATV